MLWYVLAFIVLLLLVIVTLWQSARLELEYWREGNDDRAVVHLRGPYGIVFQELEIPLADLIATPAGPGISFLQRTKDALGGEQRTMKIKVLFSELGKLRALWRDLRPLWLVYRPALNYLLNHARLEVLTWETKVGTKDAALSGILVGAVWALKGMVVTWLQRKLRVDDHQTSIIVAPYFNHSYFSTYFHCIFTIRLVHVINVQRHLFWHKLRQRKR